MVPNDLDKLAEKYGTDKWGKHHYTPFYYREFNDRRLTVKKVVEIGVGEGASLRMWAEFFPNAQIYGADNQDSRIFSEGRIKVIKCDQSKETDLRNLLHNTGYSIDLFIDDGSHLPADQIFTCQMVMFMLNKYSTYVIEDVADIKILDQLAEFNPRELKLGQRYDDRLVILKK